MDTGALVAVGLFMVGQLIASVWWASRTNTILQIVQKELRDLIVELRTMKDNYVNKSDFAEHKAPCKIQFDAIWKRIDALNKGD